MPSIAFPSIEGEGRKERLRILGVKRGEEGQRGENLHRKGKQFTEDIQIANKHMKPG